MVAENMHFRPSVGMVARRVAAGDAGEPLHMLVHAGAVRKPESWVADKEKLGGGVFVDIGIHYVRALRLLLGEPDTVSAFQPMQLNTRMTGEDGLQVIFRSEIGWQSHFLTTWSAGLGRIPDIVVIGDGGTFHLWPMAGFYDYYPVAPRPLVRMLGYVRPHWLQEKLIRPTMHRERVRFGGADDGYVEQMREFLAAVEQRRPFATPPEDGYRDLEIVNCCYASLERGQPAPIPPQNVDPNRA
jgi:predicted dehydrogenase